MSTRTKIANILRTACGDAYWHGEDSGDYDMNDADKESWFGGAVEELLSVCNKYAEDQRFN